MPASICAANIPAFVAPAFPAAKVATGTPAGKAGATNAGIFAAQMLASNDNSLSEKMQSFKAELREKTIEKDKNLERD